MAEDHPTFEQLVAYGDGALAPAQRQDIAHHLARCQRCAADVAWLARVAAGGLGAQPARPSDQALARLRRLFRARRGSAPRERRAANLQFDSARSRYSGTRSGPSTERQLLFDAPPFTLDIRLAQAHRSWTIAGQVLGPSAQGLVLAESPESSALDELNSVGEFTISRLDAGSYTLHLLLETSDIVVRGIDLDP